MLICFLFFCLTQPTIFASSHSKRVAQILFATDRSARHAGAADDVGTASFGVDAGVPQTISYGAANVFVQWADGFLPGRFPLRTQFRWTQGLKKADRESVFRDTVDMDRDGFIATVEKGVQKSPDHDILMFVHGFRTTFSEAMSSASDLSFDLKYGGVLVAFSWPSGNEVLRYDHDYENASESIGDLSSLIELLATSRPARINVIAHSMGSRVLGKAINLIQERGHKLPHFNNIVLAAPDVDPHTFQNFSPAMRAAGERVTIYISAADLALGGSGLLHIGDRVGSLRRRYSGMDVIDTGGVDTSELRRAGHSYLFDSVLVLSDLFALINSDLGPERRPNLFLAQDGCWQFEHR